MLRTSFEVRCGRRTVSVQRASTAREAIIEYLRSRGCRHDEMSTLGMNAMGWNGAVYRAVEVSTSP